MHDKPKFIFITPSALPNGQKRDGVPGGWMYYDGTVEPYGRRDMEGLFKMHNDFVMQPVIDNIERSDHPDYIKSVLCKYVGGKR